MYSRAKIGKHPIHPSLVAFPITLYLLSFLSFVAYQVASPDIFWFNLAMFANYGALVTAVIASVPGMIDFLMGIPRNTSAHRNGITHLTLNAVTFVLFAINGYMIWGLWNVGADNVNLPIALTGIGSVTLMGAGYYGWKMVGENKVGIDLTPEQQRLQERYNRTDNNDHRDPPVVFH